MGSDKNYLNYILEQLSDLDNITFRPMMGEYIIYYKEIIVGGIYDNRFLIKPVEFAKKLMPNAQFEKPYDGAKEMLLVENLENKAFLGELFNAVIAELTPKKGKRKSN